MLGLLAVAVLFFGGCVVAGLWQWGVAQDRGQKTMGDDSKSPVVALDSMLKPQQDFPHDGSLQPVRFTGHYDPKGQVLVSGRILHGTDGYWVVTPVVVNSTHARIPVVRGFVAKPSQATKPSTRTVTVTGALAPGEAPSSGDTSSGRLTTVDLPALLTRWGGNIYNGFVFLTGEQPAMHTKGVQPFPPPQPGSGGLSLVNAGYALQWWSFAAFAVFIYIRELRREAHPELRAGEAPPDNQSDKQPGNQSGEQSDSEEGTDPAIPDAPHDQTEGSHV